MHKKGVRAFKIVLRCLNDVVRDILATSWKDYIFLQPSLEIKQPYKIKKIHILIQVLIFNW
jgi:hypothetical protein